MRRGITINRVGKRLFAWEVLPFHHTQLIAHSAITLMVTLILCLLWWQAELLLAPEIWSSMPTSASRENCVQIMYI